MEGCGSAAGDRYLAAELGSVLASPAWRTQRSLAIITFEEDAYDREHPAQRVATLVLGSASVHEGYVSHRRYTHYSLLRTIEAALGLGDLTHNDRYAVPVNDAFAGTSDAGSRALDRSSAGPGPVVGSGARKVWSPPNSVRRELRLRQRDASRSADAQGRASDQCGNQARGDRHGGGRETAFVANSGSHSVTPIDLDRRAADPAIAVGADPEAIAVTPDGRTALVVSRGADAVTPIDVATRTAGTRTRSG